MSERLHPSDILTDYEITQAGQRLQAAARLIEGHYAQSASDTTDESSIGMLTFTRAQVPELENRELEVRFKDLKVVRMTLHSGWPEGFSAYFKDGVFDELDRIDSSENGKVSRVETTELLNVVKVVCASL